MHPTKPGNAGGESPRAESIESFCPEPSCLIKYGFRKYSVVPAREFPASCGIAWHPVANLAIDHRLLNNSGWIYSAHITVVGSTRKARIAGTRLPISVVLKQIPAAIENVHASSGLIPASKPCTT